MALMTKKQPQTTVETSALLQLQRLNDHPALLPLVERRGAIKIRLDAIRQEHTRLVRAAYELQHDADFASQARKREIEDEKAQLEREGGALQSELQTLAPEIELVEAQVRAELAPVQAAAGVPVLEALVAAFEHLQAASQRYIEFRQACFRRSGGYMVQTDYGFIYLPNCINLARADLERLQKLAAQQ